MLGVIDVDQQIDQIYQNINVQPRIGSEPFCFVFKLKQQNLQMGFGSEPNPFQLLLIPNTSIALAYIIFIRSQTHHWYKVGSLIMTWFANFHNTLINVM